MRRRSGIHRILRALVPAAVLVVLAAGCGTPADQEPAPPGPPTSLPVVPPTTPPVPSYAATLRPPVVATMRELRVPGAIVYVDYPGLGTWLTALGTGDLGTRAPMQVGDHMRIGSVTKTFTATVVLQLVDEGRIGVDDPVARYVAGVPNGDTITVRQLLDHRSGLYNYTDDLAFNAALDANPGRVWTDAEVLAIAYAHPPVFPPGTAFQYSNTNYVLLGQIVEKVGGAPLAQLMRQRIFAPLGMADTTLPAPADSSIPAPHQRGYLYGNNVEGAQAYAAAQAGNRAAAQVAAAPAAQPTDATDWNPSYSSAAGAAISTVHDLEIWAQALAVGVLLAPQTQARRLDFGDTEYGYGVDRSFGLLIGHNGAIPGFQTYMGYQPDRHVTIIVLTNLMLAPNTYLPDALPADRIAKVIQEQLLPT
ncbi:serine hydrolase domain-containing protein [Pseudonocardia acidicola]|uniref:Beta-lactamase family protein n=1 Tax=Pseudonocardia acidicola TaxID=2724939 RepID=A0ABX1SA14_9PSEU|nr:serine hydrolase domain-containing protein [Pseudonocardia acidicola]NMH97657.1 beta-lactamase family protein [Pseudonocardia acidicola]